MSDQDPRPTAQQDRAARLAAQLRANLHRRKAQARAIGAAPAEAGDSPAPAPTPGLPKSGARG